MTREIKFRASLLGKLYPITMIDFSTRIVELGGFTLGEPTHYSFDELDGPIEQFTGLRDTKGREIYEGDIVRCVGDTYHCASLGKVIYQGMAFQFVGKKRAKWGRDGWDEWIDTATSDVEAWNHIEVIGDIHTTPELLEAKE